MGLKGTSKMNKAELQDYIAYVINDVIEDYKKEEPEPEPEPEPEAPKIIVRSIKKL